tara:strand:- start:404 stop:955 length:552 start_codon:yes stop_codon:yes gene_type:complete
MSLVENNIENNRVFLVGQSGSGKTSCGNILSSLINWEFIDTDEKLILKHNKSIDDIFRENGEEFFRSEELILIKELIEKDKIVISTGGGTPEVPNIMDLMNYYGSTFWLKASPSEIENRLTKSNKNHRPLLFNNNLSLIKNLEQQAKKRYSLYSLASFHIDTDNKGMEGIALEIKNNIYRNHE